MKNTCKTNPKETSCSITDMGCKTVNSTENLGEYWCDKYTNVDYKTLGWYEKESLPSIHLINETKVDKNAVIFNAGAGSTTLIDSLIENSFTNLIANDISSCALKNIKQRIGVKQKFVTFIVDDLVNPTLLKKIPKVDIWNDRAVLHFFTKKEDQDTYFDLLNQKVNKNGFVIFSLFNLNGAKMCSGLPVKRYNAKMLKEKLGKNYKLLKSFDYDYKMPSNQIRKYVCTLFKKLS